MFSLYYLVTEITFPFSGILTAYGLPQIASRLVIIRFVFIAVSLAITVYFTSNIYLYLIVYIGISFIFSWLKTYISISKMDRSLWDYIFKLKNFVTFGIIYVLIMILVTERGFG